MKRLVLVLMAVLFLAGCGAAARESGFYDHSSLYSSWDHLKFSWGGYQNMTDKDIQLSKEQGWWGTTAGTPSK